MASTGGTDTPSTPTTSSGLSLGVISEQASSVITTAEAALQAKFLEVGTDPSPLQLLDLQRRLSESSVSITLMSNCMKDRAELARTVVSKVGG